MRIPAGRLLKALACLSMLWFALSLWYTTLGRHHHHHGQHGSGYDSDAPDSLESDMQRLLLPHQHQLEHHQHPRSDSSIDGARNGTTGAPRGGLVGSSWSFGDPMHEEKQLRDWRASEKHYCSHNFLQVPAGFARLRGGVLIDPSKGTGRRGGEEISEVLNQSESSEYWSLRPGAFRIVCPEKPSGTELRTFASSFHDAKSHLNTEYLKATTTVTEQELAEQRDSPRTARLIGTVLAVTRYEYANLYHSMTDFYNAFVACVYYGLDPANVTLLLVDGHPRGSLDTIWRALFGRVVRIGELAAAGGSGGGGGGGLHLAQDMVWVMMGYDSPMHNHERPHLPLHEQFRRFFLARHGVPVLTGPAAAASASAGSRNCTGIRLLFVWRRDYVAHPRNPKGRVVRKVANEAELEAEARAAVPALKLRVSSVALENMPFADQLKLASGVSILAGMHGAALAHTLFLPQQSGLMELYPNYWSPGNIHFRAMARWRGLAYDRWVNSDPANELPDYKTKFPSGVVTRLLTSVLRQMGCEV